MASDTLTHGTGGQLGKVAGRSDAGKAILHTIDPDFILGIGRISEFGARKYHMRNFLMAPGMEWSRVFESGMRHLLLWWGGEELDLGPNGEFGPTDDPETNMKWSGMPHLLHVAWNIMVLYTYSRHQPFAPGDDRPGVTEYVDGDWQDWRGEFDAARGVVPDAAPLGPEAAPEPEDPIGTVVGSHYEADGNAYVLHVKISARDHERAIREPAFLNDPVRAYYAAKNKGTTDVA